MIQRPKHDSIPRALRHRIWPIIGAVVFAVAVAGYFVGTRAPEPPAAPTAPSARADTPAPSYEQLRDRRRGPNADMYSGALKALHPPRDLFEPVVPTERDRQRALDERAARRAYDGAPPTIPHRIDPRGFPGCLACHEQGARIAGKTAPKMSHERYDSCTQCHVVEETTGPMQPRAGAITVSHGFVGLTSPERGERAWPGAPPTIPHSTHMRSRCDSCHGVGGRTGIRSTHPWRQSCTQCHTPSATLDQRARVGGPPLHRGGIRHD